MKRCPARAVSSVPSIGTGEACTLVVHQNGEDDAGGWNVELFAAFDGRDVLIARLAMGDATITPGPRVWAYAVPGATSFVARVIAPSAACDVGLYAGNVTPKGV